MARTNAAGIVLQTDGTTPDKLAELAGGVLANVSKEALSEQLKNKNYSGDVSTGSVEVRRIASSVSQNYGTARTAGNGVAVQALPVTINLDVDKEIVEEVESKDVRAMGIANLIASRQIDHTEAMKRELDEAFFAEAESAGTETTVTGTTMAQKVESLIQSIETIENDFVHGVSRDLIVVTVTPAVFGALEDEIDQMANANGVNVNLFHRVRIYSNVRQTVDAIAMVVGSVAEPVMVFPYEAEKIPHSNAYGLDLFYSYKAKAVMPDLIKYVTDFDEVSA